MTELTGLTNRQVLARRQQGQGNDVRIETSRSYRDILVSNILNPINVVLFAIGTVMIAIGRLGDAFAGVGLVLFNVVIGVIQEIRAKRQLDHIALLARPKVVAVREGRETQVDQAELVLGDLVVVSPGDQIVVDGVVVGTGRIDVDESLLTGESDLITKGPGDQVLSGSFCVVGRAIVEATRVGHDSYANKLTANARKFQVMRTPLQREINLILRLLMLLALFIGGIELLGSVVAATPLMRQVQMAAVIAGLVPNGLFFMVILAYALGALRIARCGALVQQANAVESLSNVTVLCTDKTGTLTANNIRYEDLLPVGIRRDELERVLGDFAHSATPGNKTGEALAVALHGMARPVVDEVPFSSARKWSAISFGLDGAEMGDNPDAAPLRGVYALGALEMLQPHLGSVDGAGPQAQAWLEQGARVLAFGHNPDVARLHNGSDEAVLPDLKLLGILRFGDELRPHLRDTLAQFADNGIALKVISGDNPQTVASLARQAGLPGDLRCVSGLDLERMTGAEFKQAAEEATIFGRITPDQKERLVGALREQGHYVAMIGDGVNDVLSLKKANMGIAMESGSAATRAVADMVLLGDSFGALPSAFIEGQRIVNGMRDILRVFLTRVLYSALLIVALASIGLGFPFLPKQNTLLVLLTVGIPTLGFALWSRPGAVPRRSLIREVAHFVLPAAASIFIFGLLVYIGAFYLGQAEAVRASVTADAIANFRRYAGITYSITTREAYILELSRLIAQTALTGFIVFAGLILIVFVEPPVRWFAGGDDYSGDWRPTILAGLLLLGYIAITLLEPLRVQFELIGLLWWGYVPVVLVTLVWMLVLRQAWRGRWLERFLEIEL